MRTLWDRKTLATACASGMLEAVPVSTEDADVLRAAAGDRAAFDAPAERCRPWLFGLCFRLVRDRATAEDLVQDALVRAFRGIAQLREPAKFRPWLTRIAVNLCRMYLRSRASRPEGSAAESQRGCRWRRRRPGALAPPRLCAYLDGLAGISGRGDRGRTGSFTYQLQDRKFRVTVTPDADQMHLQLELTNAAAHSAPDPVGRLAWTILARAVRSRTPTVKIALTRKDSGIGVFHLRNGEPQTAMRLRAETKMTGQDPKLPGTPIEHPLWLPIREQLAGLAGLRLRDGARRQAAHARFRFAGQDRKLDLTFTPKAIAIALHPSR